MPNAKCTKRDPLSIRDVTGGLAYSIEHPVVLAGRAKGFDRLFDYPVNFGSLFKRETEVEPKLSLTAE
jgi:hypothetical protein